MRNLRKQEKSLDFTFFIEGDCEINKIGFRLSTENHIISK